MSGKQLVFGLVGAAVLALGVAVYFVFWGDTGDSDADTPKYDIKLTATDHTLGSPAAPVQVVEYAAPTCPICARWDMTVFPSFKSAYVDTGKVFYVFRVFPLQAADLAVEAMARCLPKDNYFSFIDMMYRNQSRWDPDGYQIPDVNAAIREMGKTAGLSSARADACMSNQAELQKASAIGDYAGKTYSIHSTPSFIIDGEFHQQDLMTWQDAQDFLNTELSKKAKQS